MWGIFERDAPPCRNDVDDDELLEAVVFVLKRCDRAALRPLLEPLRGKGTTAPSWLLRSPRFFNRILEAHKDFFLYSVTFLPLSFNLSTLFQSLNAALSQINYT